MVIKRKLAFLYDGVFVFIVHQSGYKVSKNLCNTKKKKITTKDQFFKGTRNCVNSPFPMTFSRMNAVSMERNISNRIAFQNLIVSHGQQFIVFGAILRP